MEVPTSAPLLPGVAGKRCAHCNTHTTPLWRNGPDGPKTLCNACGVRDNRRHAKATRVAKPVAPKVPKGGNKNGKGDGKKRGASSPGKGEKKAAKKQKLARDYFAQKADIHVPNFNVVPDYAMNHAAGFKQPGEYLRQNVPDHQLNRFGPGTAAPMYESTPADFQWLEHMNSEPYESKSAVCATTPNAQFMRPEHLEKLFDVFEESSWAQSQMPTQEQAVQQVLGNMFNASNTAEGKIEDVLHWASNAQLGDGQLVNFKSEADAWNPFDLNDEQSNHSSSETAAPLTPSGTADFFLKHTATSGVKAEHGDDDSSTQSADDLVDRRLTAGHQQSENRKSSDLGTRAQVGLTRRGGKLLGNLRCGAQVSRPSTGGKSELKNAVQTINNKIFKINKHAPSLEVLCKIYRYWLEKRWKSGGRPLLPRFDPVPPLRLRERPELATADEQLAYLFCFDLHAVSRQQQERATRVEQAEAQKRRRRRPCFNPSACKRRRRMQAAMDDAVSRPLTMTFEPLDELFAHGWDLVDYEPEMRVAPKKKSSKQGTTLKKEQTPFKVDVSNPPAPLAPEESVVSDDIAPSNLAMASIDSHLKSPMGAAAAKAGALMKNLVSSVGCALGYGGNGRKCEAVYGSTLQADLSAPPTPAAR
ncbi:Zinc finger, GATA-type [Ostreococcus tauri]|uniref:Zinc finger, GATA-type n=1 Tax=Ostreococcus tauri TaxID=70448 RepID=A0A090M7V5_OSTTA|nr:Zinc finger, GATA-type [Ostreococcus tauri]CEG01118.1 Zinc finger, GATA-type [Ostreococcus tauri]|eukprot:XP_022840799.1 Zinc finger, GATA-type [Ostreococcus tauri]